jgi:lysophospholipase L1-like esterase
MNGERSRNRFERHAWRTGAGLVVVAVLSLELVLRVADPQPLRFAREMRRIHRYSRVARVELVPSESAHLRIDRRDGSPLLNFVLTTGPQGFRIADRPGDDDLPPPGTPGFRYVHAIGDSYTMGWGVSASSSWPAILDGLMPEDVRVLNLGVDGFGAIGATAQSLAAASGYPPAAVVYLFVPNDFDDDTRAIAVAARPRAVQLAIEAFDAVRRHSAVAAIPFALRYRLQFRAGPAAPAFSPKRATEAQSDPDRLLVPEPPLDRLPAPNLSRPTFVRLLEYRRLLQARGAGLTVLVLSTQPPSLEALRFCRERGIPAVLIETPPELRLADEGHFNALGNRAVARLVARLVGSGALRQASRIE